LTRLILELRIGAQVSLSSEIGLFIASKCLHDERMFLAEYFSFVAVVTAVLCALAFAADAKR
jgi:hypothetical protein